MPAPDRSFLDPGQVLQHVYDDATGKLRVDAEVTAITLAGAQEVLISHADDSIKIGDGTDFVAVNTDGSINVSLTTGSSSVTAVTASVTNTTLIASNSSRRGILLYNDSTSIVRVKFGTTASSSSFSFKLYPNCFYDNPTMCYTGIITGIWESANGNMLVTQLT